MYRKVVNYTNASIIGATGRQTDIMIPHNISNFGNIIQCTAFKNTGYCLPVMGGTTELSRATFINYVNNEGICLRIINDTWQPATWTFILHYTKTTD